MPLVSIIIPCYNYSNYLVFTLESLQEQVFKDWECLIIDDGSTDDTKLKAETFLKKDSRYRYIYQEQKGVSAARNKGIAQSRGSYIQFLDADDFLEHLGTDGTTSLHAIEKAKSEVLQIM